MKARFTTEQPAVRWQPLDGGRIDVAICLNGQEVTEMVEEGQEETKTEIYWEYDFCQFREQEEHISQATVEQNPEKYLGYQPEQEKTMEQKLQEQEENIRMLTECLLEMSEAVYA